MARLANRLAVAALLLASISLAANAQTQRIGAGPLQGQAQNASPVKEAACFGWGAGAGPDGAEPAARITVGVAPADRCSAYRT